MKKSFFFMLLFFYYGGMDAQEQQDKNADVIIFSYDRPLQLYALLESLEQYVIHINSITLVYRTSNERYSDAFNMVAARFPDMRFLHQQSVSDFKTLTLQAIQESSSEYVIFAVDDNIVKDFINVDECIRWLERTNAYGFYLKLGSHLDYCYTENSAQALPPMTQVQDDIFSWEFDLGEKDWHYPNTVDMTLYRKKDLISLFESFEYTNPNVLEGKWAAWWVEHKAPSPIGLFYESSKIVNIPLNKVQTINPLNRDMNLYTPQELLEAFEAGLKMDITPLYLMQNNAVHTEYEPTFISRVKQAHIGLCIMATGKYISFVKQLLDSAQCYFCPQHKRTYFIFTDAMCAGEVEKQALNELLEVPYSNHVVIIKQQRLGWPYDTLMRFVVYHQHKDLFASTDYMFATDADMLFVGVEGDEILSELVATQHPGFEKNKPLWGDEAPYDHNPLSTAYIPHGSGEYYFAGGFYGGTATEFIKMSDIITRNILLDLEEHNYIAVWHDESHLNRYFIDNKPTIMLDRSYCYPENGQQKGYPDCSPKLLALDKNHDEIRE